MTSDIYSLLTTETYPAPLWQRRMVRPKQHPPSDVHHTPAHHLALPALQIIAPLKCAVATQLLAHGGSSGGLAKLAVPRMSPL